MTDRRNNNRRDEEAEQDEEEDEISDEAPSTAGNDEDEDEDDDDGFADAVGFLFGSSEPSHCQTFTFYPCSPSPCTFIQEGKEQEEEDGYHNNNNNNNKCPCLENDNEHNIHNIGDGRKKAETTWLAEDDIKRNHTQRQPPSITIRLTSTDGDPGAVQSGHYLWPASPALAQYLVNAYGPTAGCTSADGSYSGSGDQEECNCEETCTTCGGCRRHCKLRMRNRMRRSTVMNATLSKKQSLSILELGAGCGLVGLASLLLFGGCLSENHWKKETTTAAATTTGSDDDVVDDDNYGRRHKSNDVTVKCVVFTDHDPGTLDKCRLNHRATLDWIREKESCIDKEENEGRKGQGGSSSSSLVANVLESIPVYFERLSWGDEVGARELLEKVFTKGEETVSKSDGRGKEEIPENDQIMATEKVDVAGGFDLILGSDLIYCREVVRPLLETASFLLSKGQCEDSALRGNDNNDASSSVFIMAQSFPYEAETEEEIDKVCSDLNFIRTVLEDELDDKKHEGRGGVKIQTFRKRCYR